LSETLSLTGSDRLLIIAPHPDDESIAAGGLLQVAKAGGAAIRVIVLTDGDNNPWPQRWVEKRWRIDAAARARWGAQRRVEAEAALALLGIDRSEVRFLALPDGGITDILMRNDATVMNALRDEATTFAPTMLVAPALSDRHPDHSAAFILATEACAQAGRDFRRVLTFAVHGDAPQADGVVVELNEAQRHVKYEAIRAHATQMRLSDKRFLKFAQARECYRWFDQPAKPDPSIPLTMSAQSGSLTVRIDTTRSGPLGGRELFVVAGTLRRYVTLAPDAAGVAREGSDIVVTVPVQGAFDAAYAKLARRRPGWWVFDRFGWQALS